MEEITVDTNILPLGELQSLIEEAGYSVSVVSVTSADKQSCLETVSPNL